MMNSGKLTSLAGPVLLAPDNFTPLTRTPWAGKSIWQQIKKNIIPECQTELIGESWEFSCDPDFPSKVVETGETLPQLVARLGEEIVSPALAGAGASSCEILVKLLNASKPLSVQVHPADNDPGLKPGECGKPESWLVLDAAPGSGLYLGFSRSITRDELRKSLMSGPEAADLLQFVPVNPGDFFEIQPGVCHAIGPGVLLLEPQRVMFGRSGKTLRLYDWGRLYDEDGRQTTDGKPRPLHLEEALRIVDPENHAGDSFVSTLRRIGRSLDAPKGIDATWYPDNGHYQVVTIKGAPGSQVKLDFDTGYGVAVTLAGSAVVSNVPMKAGQPALLPWSQRPFEMVVREQVSMALVFPTQSGFRIA